MRIALCDDEPALLALAERVIARFAQREGVPCEVSSFPSGRALLFETQGRYPYDLMLLDIDMPELDGMALARRIRETDTRVPLAFLTQYPHFVFEGYEVGAMRYVLKRQMEDKLPALLRDALARTSREPDYLFVDVQGETRRLDCADIVYVEAQTHETRIRLTGETLLARIPFSRLTAQLPPRFAAAHRSYAVNLDHVERIGRTQCLLSTGETVPVSRSAYAPLSRAFLAHYREVQP